MRHCVAVLGPGRSGTSIAMMLLERVGLELSGDLVPASEANPDGHFEDQRIRNAQHRFLRSLSLSPYLPRPSSWMTAPAYRQTVSSLTELVEEAHERYEQVWGFKDPRTCLLWPMWQEVFGIHEIECRPVMAVRDARTVIASMMANYRLDQAEAEGIYLYRVFHSLQDVTEGWFFVRYRDWTERPGEQLHSLATYCGLDDPSTDYERVVARAFRPSMDRHSVGSDLTVSGAVGEVDTLLASFSGNVYEQNLIDEWCASIEQRMDDLRFVLAGIDRLRAAQSRARTPTWRKRVSKRLRNIIR